MYDDEIEDAAKDNQVPKFLTDRWAEKNGDPFDAWYGEENRYFWRRLILGFGIVGLVMMCCDEVWWGLLFFVPTIFLIIMICKHPHVDDSPGHTCFRSICSLFHLFGIKPSPEIGKMNYEQFRAAVEDALQRQAKQVDELSKFDQVFARDKFNSMHKIALEWDLCHKEHSKYYPKS